MTDADVYALRGISIPASAYVSDEAREATRKMWTGGDPPPIAAPPRPSDDEVRAYILESRASADALRQEIAERMIPEFGVTVTRTEIGGVAVDIVDPEGGPVPGTANRVLINLHGGGMIFGARWEGLVASIPIAARSGLRVVTVDYRMAPEHRSPAASEDVAAVYRALLEAHEPGAIGIYGVSAGAYLTARSAAWFDANGLPMPGALALIAAGMSDDVEGDSAYLVAALSGATWSSAEERRNQVGEIALHLYAADADHSDPLVDPTASPELLARFPPTLFINSMRDGLLSDALHGHRALVRAGAETELHVWDGLWHAFLYDSALPESREAYDVISRFFARHLA